MIGKTLILVLLFLSVAVGLLVFGFRGLRATDDKFQEIEAEFHGQCTEAFGARMREPAELCRCLWHEVRGKNRLDMVKRLMALKNGTTAERADFMSRVSSDCARQQRERP